MTHISRHSLWALPLVAALALGTGCDDGGSNNNGTPDAGTPGNGNPDGGPTTGSAYTLSLAPNAVTLPAGSKVDVVVTANREAGFTSNIALALEGAPAGVTGTFAQSPLTGTSTPLTLDVARSVTPGSYTLKVKGTAGTVVREMALPITVNAPATVLLVDDDGSANNEGTANAQPSAADVVFRDLLQGKNYATLVVPKGAHGPDLTSLRDYTTVVWYTGTAEGEKFNADANRGTVSSTDELELRKFLDLGGKQLLLFSPHYLWTLTNSGTQWDTTSNAFLRDTLGVQGAEYLASEQDLTLTATGVTGKPTEGVSASVLPNRVTPTYVSLLNPGTSADTLLTFPYDREDDGTVETNVLTLGRDDLGTTAARSSAALVAFSFENVANDSRQSLFDKLLNYK